MYCFIHDFALAEHRKYFRTTCPIESIVAVGRYRTIRSTVCVEQGAVAMVFRPVTGAPEKPAPIQGVIF